MDIDAGSRGWLRPLPVRWTPGDPGLPKQVLEQLDEIVRAARDRNGRRAGAGACLEPDVREQGVIVLLRGAPAFAGVAAAGAIAAALELPAYRIDLGRVAGKYIGETERNLAAVFDEAQGSGAVLLFDEADALFGKRAEVRDARDRYASIEVDHLLRKIDCHDGIVVLAVSGGNEVDAVFLRRVRRVVEIPFPRGE